MAKKFSTTVRIVAHALSVRLTTLSRRRRPALPCRILVAHHLLLGDTVLLSALLAKLRARFPAAKIVLLTPLSMVPLYAGKPYGVEVWPFNPRDMRTVRAMRAQPTFDLALVPGDNRHSWLAAALGAKWIVAHGGERRGYKSWMVDEFVDYPTEPQAMADIFADLIPGPAAAPFRIADWPTPSCRSFDRPVAPYAVLHVGASTPLKRWNPERWRQLAEWLASRGYGVVWSGGKNEGSIVAEIDPDRRYRSYAEQLDLAQLWQLFAGASILVSPDTGVSHLARLVGTPTVTLFGPGSATLFGRGRFWQDSPRVDVTIEDFPCRDQQEQFSRVVPWVRRCGRSISECPAARCMQAIAPDVVIDAVERLLAQTARDGANQRLMAHARQAST